MAQDDELLSAYIKLGARYLSGLTLDPRLPPGLCLRFRSRAEDIQQNMAQELAETAGRGFLSGMPR